MINPENCFEIVQNFPEGASLPRFPEKSVSTHFFGPLAIRFCSFSVKFGQNKGNYCTNNKSESQRDLRGFVGQTLSRARHRSKLHSSGKKCATVKPIKASDEKTLESAIAMANALASKSMHDLDKRCLTDGYSPQPSPLTPSSPTKKLTR